MTSPRSEHNGERAVFEPTEPSRRDGDGRRRSTTARRRRRVRPALKWTLLACCCLMATTCRAQMTSTASGQKAECPAQDLILPCRCLTRGDEYQIWCSHSELPLVLDGLRLIGQHIAAPIDELILENNNLPSLPGGFFLSLRILRLMLRNNNLERVTSGWLTGLENSLMELYVVEPDLRSLPIDSLEHLNRLEAVTIKSGLMKRGPYFSHLPRLRYVQLESPSLVELSPRNFKHLPALEKLHVTGSARLTRLEANLLDDLPRLGLINVSHCAVDWVHPRAMSRLPSLTELHLVGNRISDAGMVGRATRDLQSLSVLNLDANAIEQLAEASFVDMPTLRELRIAHNRITEIHHGAFHRTPMLRTLDLNHNAIRRVHPESFLQHSGSGLEELWLVDNDVGHVSELRSLLDALPRLTFLELSRNYLEDIPFGALRGHATLERLHLDHNRIRTIEREAFTAMPALRELRMKNNSLSHLVAGPLWNLPGLKGLDLSQNHFERVEPPLLANLPSLRKLDLSENRLSVVDPATFLDTPELENVNLSHNALSSLHPATFRTLTNLYELDVGRNRLIEFVPGLPRGVEYLHVAGNQITSLPLPPSPDLDLPSLRMLDVSANGIYRVPPGSMRTLPQLRRLDLGKNTLQQLEDGCLDGLSRLEVLDLRHNRLMMLHARSLHDQRELAELNLRGNRIAALRPDVLQHAPRLKRLDVSRNLLSDIAPGTFQATRELVRLDASHNTLVQLPPSVRGLRHLEELDLTDNRLRALHPDTLNTLVSLSDLRVSRNRIRELHEGAFKHLPRLTALDLSDNELERVRPNAVRGLSSLKAIRLGRNRIRSLTSHALTDLPALESVELQENRLSSIADDAFDDVPRLLLLNLSHNALPALDEAGLRNVRSLEVLDMSHNRIARVDANALSTMEWLVELNMDSNRICTILGAPFNGMPRLRVLSLKNNRMTSLPERAVKRLRTNIAVLDLDGNPLSCSCSMMWMRAWLQEASETGPRCADGSLLREMRLTRQECSTKDGARARLQIGAEPAAPGCEAELIDAGAYGTTSQVFAPWQSGSAMQQQQQQQVQQTHGVSMAPSPEESDYFYDEYVDYPYNESSVLAAEHNNSLINDGPTPPDVAAHDGPAHESTPPGDRLSSHFVAGDTPTLYAEPKNSSDKQGAANTLDAAGVVHSSPSTSGFTFFGVPLPALGLGNLWGSGRNADRKSAIVRTRGTGRVHMFPPTDPDVQKGGFVPMLPGSGGFRPIVDPELSNRRYNYTFGSERTVSTNRTDWPSETVIHHSGSVFRQNGSDVADAASFTKRGPSLSPTVAGSLPPPPPSPTTPSPTPSAAPTTIPSFVGHKSKHVKDESKFGPIHKANIEKVRAPPAPASPAKTSTTSTERIRVESENDNVPATSPTPPSTRNGTRYFENPFVSDASPSSTSNRGRLGLETSDDDEPIDSSRTTAQRKPTASPAPWELSTNYFTMTTSTVPAITFGTVSASQTPDVVDNATAVASASRGVVHSPSRNSLSASSPPRDRDKIKNENTPSSLSALLVPGGQQPQFRPSIGRPTITKVNSPRADGDSDDRASSSSSSSSSSTSTSTERSSLDDILTAGGGNGRPFAGDDGFDAAAPPSPSPAVHDNTMGWYFRNYNASDLEPYVGPGADSQAPQHVGSSTDRAASSVATLAPLVALVSIAARATPCW